MKPAIIRITLTVGALLCALSLATKARPAEKIHRIGVLEAVGAASNADNLHAFRQVLRELGYVEGQNLMIEYRSADGLVERFRDLASELIRLDVDVIVTRGTPAALAAKRATGAIPIVRRRVATLSPRASSPAWLGREGMSPDSTS